MRNSSRSVTRSETLGSCSKVILIPATSSEVKFSTAHHDRIIEITWRPIPTRSFFFWHSASVLGTPGYMFYNSTKDIHIMNKSFCFAMLYWYLRLNETFIRRIVNRYIPFSNVIIVLITMDVRAFIVYFEAKKKTASNFL